MIVNVFEYAEKLEKSGFTKSQAEASLQVLVEIMNQEFSTKQDIELLSRDLGQSEFSLKTDLQRVEVSLRSDMEKMETSIRSDMQKMETSIRSDMQKMETSIRSDMEKIEASLRADIQEVRNDIVRVSDKLTIRLGGMMAVSLTIIFGMLQFVGVR